MKLIKTTNQRMSLTHACTSGKHNTSLQDRRGREKWIVTFNEWNIALRSFGWIMTLMARAQAIGKSNVVHHITSTLKTAWIVFKKSEFVYMHRPLLLPGIWYKPFLSWKLCASAQIITSTLKTAQTIMNSENGLCICQSCAVRNIENNTRSEEVQTVSGTETEQPLILLKWQKAFSIFKSHKAFLAQEQNNLFSSLKNTDYLSVLSGTNHFTICNGSTHWLALPIESHFSIWNRASVSSSKLELTIPS